MRKATQVGGANGVERIQVVTTHVRIMRSFHRAPGTTTEANMLH